MIFKNSSFFEKKHLFLQKKQTLYATEKSHYFSRILRQICYKFGNKSFLKNRTVEHETFTSDIINKQLSAKKRSLWVDDFAIGCFFGNRKTKPFLWAFKMELIDE